MMPCIETYQKVRFLYSHFFHFLSDGTKLEFNIKVGAPYYFYISNLFREKGSNLHVCALPRADLKDCCNVSICWSECGNFVPTVNSVNFVPTRLKWQILFILLIHFQQSQVKRGAVVTRQAQLREGGKDKANFAKWNTAVGIELKMLEENIF